MLKILSLEFSYKLIINNYEKWKGCIYKNYKIKNDRKQK